MNIGLQEVYLPPEGVEAVANICFVHGLFGGPWKSFSAKRPRSDAQLPAQAPDGSSTNQGPRDAKAAQQVFWPRDLLPRSINNVRIFTFGYDADIGRFMGAAGLNSLYQHARNPLNATSDLLEQTAEPLPIIFVAHSLGGLVVKQALNQSATSTDARKNRTLGYTRGIIFLGTPHHGSSAATYGRTAFRLSKKIAFQSANIKLLTALERNSEQLDQLSTEFCETLEKNNALRMWSFYEEKQVRFGVVGMQIVPADSARIRHIKEDWGSISGDHRQIAKYSSTQDDGFVKVNNVLKGWVRDIERDPQNNFSESEEYKECLKTLDDADARLRVQGVYQASQTNPSSFEWLFTEKVPFSKWLQDDTKNFSPIFWITGRPGSGKSTLMRFALEDRRTIELLPESTGDPVSYFFHLRGKSTTQKSLKGMLKELMYQLLGQFPHFYAQIGPIYKRRVRMLDPRDWGLDSLTEAFLQIPKFVSSSRTLRDRIFLFIDALDENEIQHENETMMTLIKRLSAEYESVAKTSHPPLLKICLASRPWPLFQKELGGNSRIPSLAIHNFTTKDIQSYASALLDEPLQSLRLPVAQRGDFLLLVAEIARGANGVFVWVRVVVDNLRREIMNGSSIKDLKEIVSKCPPELKDLYEYTVNRIPEHYWKELEVALKVLYSSQKALTLSELYVITQLCIDQKPPDDFQASQHTLAWLASRSGGLIEDITMSPTFSDGLGQQQVVTISSVQFIHQTVQDFVRAGIRGLPEPRDGGPRLLIPSGHHLIALACLENMTPHPCLSEVAKDVFSYFRECERDWDTGGRVDDSYIRLWTSTYLLDGLNIIFENNRLLEVLYFMNESERRKMVEIIAGFQGEDLSVDRYLDNSISHGARQAIVAPSPESMRKTPTEAVSTVHQGQPITSRQSATHESANTHMMPIRARLRKAIRAVMALNRCGGRFFSDIMLISQNLYYPKFWDRNVNDWGGLATMAALGQRLAKDRTDRPRMLKGCITYLIGLDITAERLRGWMPAPMALDVEAAPEVEWRDRNALVARIATAIPSPEITDAMLRHMMELLLEDRNQAFGGLDDWINFDAVLSPLYGFHMSILEYCTIFKGNWIQLILRHASSRMRHPNILRRVLILKMGLTYEDEEPDTKQGLVFPGLLAAASCGLSLRYIYLALSDSEF